jgi:hypothetical protein
MVNPNNLAGIMITLLAGGDHSLFIMLGSDGSINRMGTGAVDNRERDMFIGKTDPALFDKLRQQIGPELLAWFGQQLADPEPRGTICELTVGLKEVDGEESATVWRYGAESTGPPPEVGEFVISAVRATETWFDQQKAMAARRRD